MTADEILTRWDSVSVCFGYKPEAWLRLIRIASYGPTGCTMRDLFPKINGWRHLTHWRRASLIEVIEVRDGLNRRQSRIRITAKGMKLLRLTQLAPAA